MQHWRSNCVTDIKSYKLNLLTITSIYREGTLRITDMIGLKPITVVRAVTDPGVSFGFDRLMVQRFWIHVRALFSQGANQTWGLESQRVKCNEHRNQIEWLQHIIYPSVLSLFPLWLPPSTPNPLLVLRTIVGTYIPRARSRL